MINIEFLKKNKLLLFECISGSKAYGLDTPESDTDIKGVFVLPKKMFYGLDYAPQINNESHDIVYYEIKRYIELLTKNNPNLLEMLCVDPEFIIYEHPLWCRIKQEMFLSKLCKETFAGYAVAQIKKARGLKKKILNPMDKKKKSILDFIYVIEGYKSLPLNKWLEKKKYKQEYCGLVNIPHMKNIYALFYDSKQSFRFSGIIKTQNSMDVTTSSIPEGLKQESIISVNVDGYSRYCKEYSAYWDWVNKRNDARYKNTLSHGKKYDAKNMMHTFRLLGIAREIAETGSFRTKRPNRDELLKIKSGEFEYEELIERANSEIEEISILFAEAKLQDEVDRKKANKLLYEIREEFYSYKRKESEK